MQFFLDVSVDHNMLPLSLFIAVPDFKKSPTHLQNVTCAIKHVRKPPFGGN